MSTPTVLSLDSAKVREFIPDIVLSQHWEVLRCAARPLDAHELAAACGISDADSQGSLDRLVETGLAVRIKANARTKRITYRTVSDRVVVQWDSAVDAHFECLLEFRRRLRAYSRSVIDRNDDAETRRLAPGQKFRGHQSFVLTPAEASVIAQALRSAWETITAVEGKARARAEAQGGVATETGEASGDEERRPYHIALEFRPLKSPELPLGDIGVWEKKSLPKELAYLAQAPASVLAPRELEVARRLAAGESRPMIAKSLGVTLNTVASATKRIYAKLGVRSRAEFVNRMKHG